MRLLKCYGFCNEKHPKEKLVKIGTHNYCSPCALQKEKEIKDREVLYKTIETVYKIPYPTGQMLGQIRQYKEDRNYTYEGLTMTICYFVKVMTKQPKLQAGLAFVPYNYDKAVEYYRDQAEKREKAKDIDETKVKIITIQPPQRRSDNIKFRKFIKMEDLT